MPTTYKWVGTTSGAFGTSTNFNPNGNPATGDTVIFDYECLSTNFDLAGSDQSAITLAALIVYKSFGKSIGTTATPLKIGATIVQIGLNLDPSLSFSGPTRVVLDMHTVATTVEVFDSGTGNPDTGLENIRIKGVNASNAFYLISSTASVGLGTNNVADVATFPTISVVGGRLNIGAGVTYTTLTMGSQAQVTAFAGPITLVMSGSAQLATYGDFVITTATINGGTWNASHRKTGGASITTLNRNAGKIDFSQDPRALTITTFNKGAGEMKVFSSSQLTVTTTVPTFGNNLSETVSLAA